jgi:hypothetical protein
MISPVVADTVAPPLGAGASPLGAGGAIRVVAAVPDTVPTTVVGASGSGVFDVICPPHPTKPGDQSDVS